MHNSCPSKIFFARPKDGWLTKGLVTATRLGRNGTEQCKFMKGLVLEVRLERKHMHHFLEKALPKRGDCCCHLPSARTNDSADAMYKNVKCMQNDQFCLKG